MMTYLQYHPWKVEMGTLGGHYLRKVAMSVSSETESVYLPQ